MGHGLQKTDYYISTIYFDDINDDLVNKVKQDPAIVKLRKDRFTSNIPGIQLRNVQDLSYNGHTMFDRCMEKYNAVEDANCFMIRDDHPDYAWILLQAK